MFAYIAKDGKTEKHYCHVFRVETTVSQLPELLFQTVRSARRAWRERGESVERARSERDGQITLDDRELPFSFAPNWCLASCSSKNSSKWLSFGH